MASQEKLELEMAAKKEEKPKRIPVKRVTGKKPVKRAKAESQNTENCPEHTLIPMHKKIPDEEKKQIYDKYHATAKEMPKILATDPAIRGLSAKEGDLIEVLRKSNTAGEIKFYRSVVDE